MPMRLVRVSRVCSSRYSKSSLRCALVSTWLASNTGYVKSVVSISVAPKCRLSEPDRVEVGALVAVVEGCSRVGVPQIRKGAHEHGEAIRDFRVRRVSPHQ